MADIHIVREHALGLAQARKLALRWAEVAEQKLEMECVYEQGKAADVVSFRRPGASGALKVTWVARGPTTPFVATTRTGRPLSTSRVLRSITTRS